MYILYKDKIFDADKKLIPKKIWKKKKWHTKLIEIQPTGDINEEGQLMEVTYHRTIATVSAFIDLIDDITTHINLKLIDY